MVTRLIRLENEWKELDMERDHITEEMQYLRKEILKIQFKNEKTFTGITSKHIPSEVSQ